MVRHHSGDTPNVVSFDLEHWHSATLLRDHLTDPRDHVRESVETVLALLDDHDTLATFFVVGEVARRYPDLIRRVAEAGHEIASHGHTHRPLFELSPAEFRTELNESADAIERATGARPEGFRAPNFSVTRETPWAFDELRAAGYRYDSSVFPVKTPMYGVSGAPLEPYTVGTDPFEGGSLDAAGLREVPVAVFDPRGRFPIAGGFYARLLPTRVLAAGIRNLNRRNLPATIYFHPWEFNPAVRRDDVPAIPRFVSFHGIDRLSAKLDRLLSTFEFTTVAELLERRVGSSTRAR